MRFCPCKSYSIHFSYSTYFLFYLPYYPLRLINTWISSGGPNFSLCHSPSGKDGSALVRFSMLRITVLKCDAEEEVSELLRFFTLRTAIL